MIGNDCKKITYCLDLIKYMESKMTAEEIVLGGYKNFAEGDME